MPKRRLDGKRFDGYYMDPTQIKIVGLDVPISDDLAYLYDPRIEADVDENMVKNIMVYGVTEPVIVTNINNVAYVVDGRGRVRSARVANKKLAGEGKEQLRVPVVLRRGPEHELFGVMVSSNEIRKDDNAMAKAKKVQRFLNMGRTKQEAAIAFGVSDVSISNWTKMLELALPVQKLVEEGKLSANAASKLYSLDPEEQTKKALELVTAAKETGKKPTANRIRQAVTGQASSPGKALVRKIVQVEEITNGKINKGINPEYNNFMAALRFFLGDLSAEEIGINLTAIEDEAENIKKAERAAKKAEEKAKKAAAKALKAKKEADAAMKKREAADAIKRGVIVVKKKGGKSAA